ncbi:hypothetical protein PG993_013092 [Apiospora rasikravindrae]|uniref:2EXR domain-containing protein n=1 Tax=Apiospora rasikravindrae TaxID=990691 RepID=A0ABR1RXZ9_9PEZI
MEILFARSLATNHPLDSASHTTVADPTPEAPRIFHRFPNLPPELRGAIWAAAARNAFALYHSMTEKNPRLFCLHIRPFPEQIYMPVDPRLDFKAAEQRLIKGLMALLLASKESSHQSKWTIRRYQKQEEQDRQLPMLGLWGCTNRGSPMRQLLMPRNDILCMQHSLMYFAVRRAQLGRFIASTGRRLHHILIGIDQATTMDHQQTETLLQRVPHLETLYVDVSLLRVNMFPHIIPINTCQLHHYDYNGNMTWLCDLPPVLPSENDEESVDSHGEVADDDVAEGAGSSQGPTQEGEGAVDYHRILGRLRPGTFQTFWTLCGKYGVTIRFVARTGWHAKRFRYDEF